MQPKFKEKIKRIVYWLFIGLLLAVFIYRNSMHWKCECLKLNNESSWFWFQWFFIIERHICKSLCKNKQYTLLHVQRLPIEFRSIELILMLQIFPFHVLYQVSHEGWKNSFVLWLNPIELRPAFHILRPVCYLNFRACNKWQRSQVDTLKKSA